jgi:hypothetical protein
MNSIKQSSPPSLFGLRKLPARYAGIVMPLLLVLPLVRSATRAIVEST